MFLELNLCLCISPLKCCCYLAQRRGEWEEITLYGSTTCCIIDKKQLPDSYGLLVLTDLLAVICKRQTILPRKWNAHRYEVTSQMRASITWPHTKRCSQYWYYCFYLRGGGSIMLDLSLYEAIDYTERHVMGWPVSIKLGFWFRLTWNTVIFVRWINIYVADSRSRHLLSVHYCFTYYRVEISPHSVCNPPISKALRIFIYLAFYPLSAPRMIAISLKTGELAISINITFYQRSAQMQKD